MKRYVAKFLRAHGRELIPGGTSSDMEKLGRVAWNWWRANIRCRPNYRAHIIAHPKDWQPDDRSIRFRTPEYAKETVRSESRHFAKKFHAERSL